VREVPTLEHFSLEAEREKGIVLSEHARKGGKAARIDAFQRLTDELVRKYPRIGVKQFLADLEGSLCAGVITSIDIPSDVVAGDPPCIHYLDDDGKPKTASIKGLKDRLSKAKKRLKNSL